MPRFSAAPLTTGRDDPSLLDVPMWDAVKATASETFGSSPTEATSRADQVQLGRKGRDRLDLRLPWLREDDSASRFVPGKQTSPLLTKEQAAAKIDSAGLTGQLKVPEQGENEASLDLLIRYKTDELRNKFILDRYRGGVAGGAVNLGTALATSLVDPINIGSAFIPIAGEARYAALLGQAGKSMVARAGVRAGVGAIEGAVGAAMVEPLVYRGKKEIQADYDAMDSLMNVGFGGLFGGVLQPATGAVGDVFARRAGIGAWAEPTTGNLESAAPAVPEGWLGGGGTQFVDGEDYVNGSWVVVDASSLPQPSGQRLGTTDAGQVGASPWADSGAPVVDATGAVRNGNSRMTTILGDYADGQGMEYRNQLIESAERYGLDGEQVSALQNPVLVRLEGERKAGAWGEYQRMLADTPAVRAARQPFESPDVLASRQFIERARGRGVSQEVAQDLVPAAPRDDVTGFYDGRQSGMKSGTVQRAIAHAKSTGEPAAYVSADIANLGGLNAAVGNRADEANVHFREMAAIMDRELRKTGADVVPMRTGGDELGAVVVNARLADVDAALTRAEAGIMEYAKANGLDAIPHPKGGAEGVGMHFGMAEIRGDSDAGQVFARSDNGVDISKRGGGNDRAEVVASQQVRLNGRRVTSAAVNAAEQQNAQGRMIRAAQVIDDRLERLQALSESGRKTKSEIAALTKEDEAALSVIRQEEERRASGIVRANPKDRVTDSQIAQLSKRREEIRAELERARTAQGYEYQLQKLNERLSKIDSDSELFRLAETLSPIHITAEQNQVAVSVGVAQAVNGSHINPSAAMELDGTQAGVERFLEMQRLAEAGVVAERDTQLASLASIRQSLEEFSPEQTAKLEQDVDALEARLREDVRAAGGDEADIDAALADVADIAAEAEIESKALKGISLCMLRNV